MERILKTFEYEIVYKKGRRVRAKKLLLLFLAGERKRLGITIGRRVCNAAKRNRIKRVVRELFRLENDKFPHGDLVVHVMDGAGALTNKELREELVLGLERFFK